MTRKFVDLMFFWGLSLGVVDTLAGSTNQGNADGVGYYADFNSPFGCFIDTLGNVFVADTGSSKIRKIATSSNLP